MSQEDKSNKPKKIIRPEDYALLIMIPAGMIISGFVFLGILLGLGFSVELAIWFVLGAAMLIIAGAVIMIWWEKITRETEQKIKLLLAGVVIGIFIFLVLNYLGFFS